MLTPEGRAQPQLLCHVLIVFKELEGLEALKPTSTTLKPKLETLNRILAVSLPQNLAKACFATDAAEKGLVVVHCSRARVLYYVHTCLCTQILYIYIHAHTYSTYMRTYIRTYIHT